MTQRKKYTLRPSNRDALEWIAAYRRRHGYPPSRREIGDAFDIVPSTAQDTIGALIEEGLIEVTPGVPRGINITGAGMKIISEDL